jgi:hypothetical protein
MANYLASKGKYPLAGLHLLTPAFKHGVPTKACCNPTNTLAEAMSEAMIGVQQREVNPAMTTIMPTLTQMVPSVPKACMDLIS